MLCRRYINIHVDNAPVGVRSHTQIFLFKVYVFVFCKVGGSYYIGKVYVTYMSRMWCTHYAFGDTNTRNNVVYTHTV